MRRCRFFSTREFIDRRKPAISMHRHEFVQRKQRHATHAKPPEKHENVSDPQTRGQGQKRFQAAHDGAPFVNPIGHGRPLAGLISVSQTFSCLLTGVGHELRLSGQPRPFQFLLHRHAHATMGIINQTARGQPAWNACFHGCRLFPFDAFHVCLDVSFERCPQSGRDTTRPLQ